MDQVKEALDRESRRVAAGIETEFEHLKKEEQLLQQQLQAQKEDLLTLKDRSIQYNILKREWETNKELYTGLLERMKEVGVAAGMEINNIAVIDRAKIPVQKHSPSLTKKCLVGNRFGFDWRNWIGIFASVFG